MFYKEQPLLNTMRNKEATLELFTETTGKPFLKWAGGKTQLLPEISNSMPAMDNITTYVEPFVGSGAVMFWVINTFKNIQRVIINDFNIELTNVYGAIKTDVDGLIKELQSLDREYKTSDFDGQKEMFYAKRDEYNERVLDGKSYSTHYAALFIFLNRTCFNGLYRVNAKNKYNVPMGKYANPNICDEKTLLDDNVTLQKVEILNGDFAGTLQYASPNTFYYLDPPYKPISDSSNFNTYSSETFDDAQQIRLKEFCDEVSNRNAFFMLSNSDPKSVDNNNDFFDVLYQDYTIKRVLASRRINSKSEGRGEINELLITNY